MTITQSPPRLFLVSPSSLVRVGIRAILAEVPDLTIIGEASTGSHALSEIDRLRPDVVVLDAEREETDSLSVCRALSAGEGTVRVLVLVGAHQQATLIQLVQAGANGVVLSQDAPRVLPHAVGVVTTTGAYLDPQMIPSALNALRVAAQPRYGGVLERLSPREQNILPLLAKGMTNKEIAAVLGLSDVTVKNYLHNLFRKLGITRRSWAAGIYEEFVRVAGCQQRERGASRQGSNQLQAATAMGIPSRAEGVRVRG